MFVNFFEDQVPDFLFPAAEIPEAGIDRRCGTVYQTGYRMFARLHRDCFGAGDPSDDEQDYARQNQAEQKTKNGAAESIHPAEDRDSNSLAQPPGDKSG